MPRPAGSWCVDGGSWPAIRDRLGPSPATLPTGTRGDLRPSTRPKRGWRRPRGQHPDGTVKNLPDTTNRPRQPCPARQPTNSSPTCPMATTLWRVNLARAYPASSASASRSPALRKDGPILIMDEAVSDLDVASEHESRRCYGTSPRRTHHPGHRPPPVHQPPGRPYRRPSHVRVAEAAGNCSQHRAPTSACWPLNSMQYQHPLAIANYMQ